MLPSLHEQLECALRALEILYPDQVIERLVVYLQCGARVVLPVLLPRSGQPPAGRTAPPPFEPSEKQRDILQALGEAGTPLTADALAAAVGCARQTLYAGRGIGELIERGQVVKGEFGYQLPAG